MKPETREWLHKADGDYATASREQAVADSPNHDAVCFHAQQAAEKYLKARLIEARIPVPRTHDLEVLLDLARAVEPAASPEPPVRMYRHTTTSFLPDLADTRRHERELPRPLHSRSIAACRGRASGVSPSR